MTAHAQDDEDDTPPVLFPDTTTCASCGNDLHTWHGPLARCTNHHDIPYPTAWRKETHHDQPRH